LYRLLGLRRNGITEQSCMGLGGGSGGRPEPLGHLRAGGIRSSAGRRVPRGRCRPASGPVPLRMPTPSSSRTRSTTSARGKFSAKIFGCLATGKPTSSPLTGPRSLRRFFCTAEGRLGFRERAGVPAGSRDRGPSRGQGQACPEELLGGTLRRHRRDRVGEAVAS
jgi:hypothetical protein